jgi:hypothetical protein
MASKPALIINTVLEGSGTLATRNPMALSELDGVGSLRAEERRSPSVLSQKPPRIARFSDEELFIPSKALSCHSHTFPFCPIVP